ncbi:MAG: lipoprotein-releasing system transmembrane subunit LolC [Candidatus Pelagibacter sp. TMED64]|nr:lipoprotein-releasing system transmembrane subunit LolC [Candidatus Pelagibacter sp.]OUU67970.1 MAG: lipoprotein-releasing system transmembrane subunit LolC [Candidatus Pelagibacter sp. TMED64]
MISKVENKIAFRYLKPKKKEGFLKIISIFSFTGISLGVAILIIVMSVMNGFRTELIDKILGFNPHIIIKSYDKPISNITKLDIKKINKDIKSISYSFSGEGIIINQGNSKGIVIRGYSKEDLKKTILSKKNIFEGSLNNFNKNTISIGKDLAIVLDLMVGDKITLMSSSSIETIFGNLPLQKTFSISSIFDSGLSEFNQNVVFMNLNDSISFFEGNKEDIFIEVNLIKPENANIIKNMFEEKFSNAFIYTWSDLNQSFFSALIVERNVMFIILTLIIIVAAFNIISGLTILVKNKTKEIAILRTLGLSKKSIAKIFFLTGFSIGFFATITGIFLGVLFSIYIENIRTFISTIFNVSLFPEEIYFLSKMPSEINIYWIFIVFIFSIIITTLATIFPSLKAASLDPIQALKYE